MIKTVAPVVRHARLFMKWWFTELSGLIPGRMHDLLHRRRVRVLVEFDGERPVVTSIKAGKPTEKAAGQVRKGTACHLRIPSRFVLRKILVLPMATADSLRDVLRFQIEQETPFRQDDVYFDYAVTARDAEAKQIILEWRLAPKAVIDRARKAAEQLGLTVASAGPVDQGTIVGTVDFFRSNRPTKAEGPPWMRRALAACVAAFAVATVAVPLVKKQRAVSIQTEQVVEARVAAQATLRLREQIAALRDTRDFVLEKRLEQPTVSLLLRDLTALVPDDAWLHRLTIDRGEVSIAGVSPAPSTLVQDIEADPGFEQVSYRSPTMRRADSGLDEFNLSFRISREAPVP
ncbi:PilN domain-containing protein [Rhodospirillaceae bacterium SYSU D60014]|uniref:PilN domain-containing protein n=1 Tax=Virgifigura deserti TaxID=2268457 RepID=UPI0013C40056